MLVFLITNIKNEDNEVYVDGFKHIIWQRKKYPNLENIADETLKIVFQQIKINHSSLVAQFKKMMLEQQDGVKLSKDIALPLLTARKLIGQSQFGKITGLALNKAQSRLKIHKASANIFEKTINKYLIQPSNQNNLEASGATLVEPDEGLEQLVENFEEQYPVTDQKNTTQNLEEQHPLTDEKNTTQNFEKQYPVLGKIWSSYTHFFSKKDLGNIGRTCKKFQIACTPRYDYSKVASTTEVFRFIDSGRILCQSLDSLMYAIAESSTKDIVVYGRKDKKIELITRLRQTTVDKESNPVIQYQQIVFSLDSKYMIACATALKDVDRIYTWNIKTQELISKTSFPKDESFSWSFPIYQCLDLKSIIICSNDAKIYKYDFIEGTKTKLLDLRNKESVEKDPFQKFSSVVISNNQERILVANYRRNQITIYNLKDGSVIRNYTFNGKDKWSQNYHPFKFISKDKQFIHIEDGYLCIKGIDKTFDFKLAIGLELHTPDTLSRFSFSLSQNERFLVIPCLKEVVVMDLEVLNKDFLVIKCDDTVESAFFNSDNSSLMILANNVLTEYTFNALGLGNYFDSARLSYPGLGR